MMLHVLMQERRCLTTGTMECTPVFAGSQAECRKVLFQMAGFTSSDPDTWIVFDMDDGNDGEVEIVYEIKPVGVSRRFETPVPKQHPPAGECQIGQQQKQMNGDEKNEEKIPQKVDGQRARR